MAEQIYGLIAQAMKKVGAIGKDSVNQQQKYKFRGIDAVYNALNPVMSELGLFICPEILEQRREERQNTNGTILKYSILTIRYTMFAPDGSSVSCTVVGEGMDSGDKASNKAMSVALKYACFQLFMIPTEEMVDPDAETHEVTSSARKPAAPRAAQQAKQEKVETPKPVENPAQVSTAKVLPNPENPVAMYIAQERLNLQKARDISVEDNQELFTKQLAILRQNKLAPEKALSKYTLEEAQALINNMYCRFLPLGTELKAVDEE